MSFFTQTKEVKNNLKELSREFKQEELHEIKEFREVIYRSRCCVVESKVEAQTTGIITFTSRNIDDVFGRTRPELIGENINSLMPAFPGKDHDVVLNSWRRSGTWRTMGKLKEVYCMHKDGHCFSALLYLKLIVKHDALYLITNIFHLNSNDYLVVDKHATIHNMGKRFQALLGTEATGLNLNRLRVPPAPQEDLLQLSDTKEHLMTIASADGLR